MRASPTLRQSGFQKGSASYGNDGFVERFNRLAEDATEVLTCPSCRNLAEAIAPRCPNEDLEFYPSTYCPQHHQRSRLDRSPQSVPNLIRASSASFSPSSA